MKNLHSYKTAIQFTTNGRSHVYFVREGKTFLYKIHPLLYLDWFESLPKRKNTDTRMGIRISGRG